MLRQPDDPESEAISLNSEQTAAENDEPIKGRSLQWLKSTIKSPSRPGYSDLEADARSSGAGGALAELGGLGYGATSDSSRPFRALLDPVRPEPKF